MQFLFKLIDNTAISVSYWDADRISWATASANTVKSLIWDRTLVGN